SRALSGSPRKVRLANSCNRREVLSREQVIGPEGDRRFELFVGIVISARQRVGAAEVVVRARFCWRQSHRALPEGDFASIVTISERRHRNQRQRGSSRGYS